MRIRVMRMSGSMMIRMMDRTALIEGGHCITNQGVAETSWRLHLYSCTPSLNTLSRANLTEPFVLLSPKKHLSHR